MFVSRYVRCLTSKVKSLKRRGNRRRQTHPHLLTARLEPLEARVLLSVTPSPVEVAKLLASDAEAGDLFGISVSVDGDTALVGALNSGSATPSRLFIFIKRHGYISGSAIIALIGFVGIPASFGL